MTLRWFALLLAISAVVSSALFVHFKRAGALEGGPSSHFGDSIPTGPGTSTTPSLSGVTGSPTMSQGTPVADSAIPPSVSQSGTSSQPELPMSEVIGVWLETGARLHVAPQRLDVVTSWLRHVLTHRHRRIDRPTIDSFRESLVGFPSNAGIDLSGDDREGTDVLRFCISLAWGPQLAGLSESGTLKQFELFRARVLAHVQDEIVQSMQPDTAATWRQEIKDALRQVAVRVDHRSENLSQDFLFPAFKQPLTSIEADIIVRQLDGFTMAGKIIPIYGGVDRMMQTQDQAFEDRLRRFTQYFDLAYTSEVTVQQTTHRLLVSHDWSDRDYDFRVLGGAWPLTVELSAPKQSINPQGSPP